MQFAETAIQRRKQLEYWNTNNVSFDLSDSESVIAIHIFIIEIGAGSIFMWL